MRRLRSAVVGLAGMALVAAVLAGAGSSSAVTPGHPALHGQGWSEPAQSRIGALPNAAGQSQVFYISGSAAGLYPGSSSTLTLSVQNPLNTPITVNTITLVAGSPSSGCPSSLLTIPPSWTLNSTYTINTSLSVPANSTVTGPSVTLSLAMTATNACAGVTFPLMYGGTATG